MAQATPYTPTTDFSEDERDNVGGRSTILTADLDAELAAISTSINALIANVALNQRDDGNIRDGRVKLFTLSSEVLAVLVSYGATPRGNWQTATLYNFKDLVVQGGNTYMAVVPHVSGVFATDLAAQKWILFSLGASPGATQVSFTPTATLSATNVQTAIDEADTENRALSAAIVANLANSANVVLGDALIAVKNPAAGGVARTQHDKNLDWVCANDFGVIGNGTANDTAAMQAVHDAYFNVYYRAGYYKTTGKIQLRPGARIQGESAGQTVFVLQADMGAELDALFECKVAAANFDTQQAGVTVRDVSIIGDAHFGHGFLLQNIRFPIFDNVWINNFVGAALLIDYAEEGHFDFLNVNNCGRTAGNANVTADTTYGQITFHRSANAVPGVSSNFLRFNGCTIANGKCSGDIMVKSSSPSRIYFNDCQSEVSGASIGNRDWLIGGNMGGIFFFKNNDVVNYRNCFDKVHFMEIYATDNRVTNSTKYYVGANGSGTYVGKGNRTNGAIDYVSINAFDAVNDTYGAASFQFIFNVSLVGCRMDSLLVSDVSGGPSLRVVASQIIGNVTVNDFPYNGLFAFNLIGGNSSLANCLVFGNRITGTDTQNTATTQVPRKPVTNASSAAAMTLPVNSDLIFVNGTTTVTSIANPAPFAGRTITLLFNGALTFTKGSNLFLASNFVTTSNDTITLVGDGTNFYEIGRSVN